MVYYNLTLCVILFVLQIAYSITNILFRRRIPIIIVNMLALIFSATLVALEITNITREFAYCNYHLTNILLLFVVSNFINSLFVKEYQEIRFNYNMCSLSIIFSILTIIFCLYMFGFSKTGDFSFMAFILVVALYLLYFVASIGNIILTKQMLELINLRDENNSNNFSYTYKNIASKEIIVVRKFDFSKRNVTYVKNRNYKTTNIKSYCTILFYYAIAIILILI